MTVRSRFLSIAALLAVASLGLASCGDDGSVLGVGPSSSTSPTTSPVDNSETTTSTEAAATSITSPITTTTTAAPTTTSSTTTSSTTTTTVPSPALEFLPDGLGIVDFGATPVAAIDAVRTALGFDKTFDSGWGPAWGGYGACPGTEYRQVEFDGLILAFTDEGLFAPQGTRQFYSWTYNGSPVGITAGLDIGTTVADLQVMYPAVDIGYDDMWFGDYFRVPYSDARGLWGTLTGPNPGDTVAFMIGGIGCGE